MREDFLHYIWQFQKFDRTALKLTTGEPLQVVKPGLHNHDAGPDFSQGTVRIDGLSLNGHIEIHINSSDWDAHKHQHDPAYNGVILHVVLHHDREVYRQDGTQLPTLELQERIHEFDHKGYQRFVNRLGDIVCEQELPTVDTMVKVAAMERALMERLERKAGRVYELHSRLAGHWNAIVYALLGECFGFKINKEPFRQLVSLVPYGIVQKVKSQHEIEALLFGVAGFLMGRAADAYHQKLMTTYAFLKRKFNLQAEVAPGIWKFGRLRPANFPTVRIAQFASVLVEHQHLFDRLSGATSLQMLRQFFNINPDMYWQNHYQFGHPSSSTTSLGKSSIDTLIVNAVIPTWIGYGKLHQSDIYVHRALQVLQMLRPESNRITRRWEAVGLRSTSSADSQGLIELFQNYCAEKRCLWCNIGSSILSR